MGNIIENDVWSDVIRQLEENEMVEGGADGIDNIPHKQLAGRTNWLKNSFNALSSKISGTNTGDETADTIKTKLGITTLSGANTGDETAKTIKTKLGVTALVAGVRLGTVAHFSTYGSIGFYDTNGYVVTGVVATSYNALVDDGWVRPIQVTFDNATWYNITSI